MKQQQPHFGVPFVQLKRTKRIYQFQNISFLIRILSCTNRMQLTSYYEQLLDTGKYFR